MQQNARMRLGSRSFFVRLGFLCSLAAMIGCDRAIVSGKVVTYDGEALPGVIVSVEDEPGLEALSNAVGAYRLIAPAGLHALRYSKSGYAPAASSVEAAPGATVTLDDVMMWRLPRSKGVYLYEEGQFVSTTHAEPRTFLLEGDSADYAIRGVIETRTENEEPLILCYHMPRYEARLTRLRVSTAQLREGQDYTFDVFARGGTIPVRLMPVDQPEGVLMRVAFDEPLEEGAYALHWGAMIGETVLEPRAYLFEIGGPAETVEELAGDTRDEVDAVENPEAPEDVPDAEAASEETEN
jgi:hypothetical protein